MPAKYVVQFLQVIVNKLQVRLENERAFNMNPRRLTPLDFNHMALNVFTIGEAKPRCDADGLDPRNAHPARVTLTCFTESRRCPLAAIHVSLDDFAFGALYCRQFTETSIVIGPLFTPFPSHTPP